MEDQILQYEMTDMLGKSHDSELGQNPINIACHEKQNRKAKIYNFPIYWNIFII